MSANTTNRTIPLAQCLVLFTAIGAPFEINNLITPHQHHRRGRILVILVVVPVATALITAQKFGNAFALCMLGFALF
jgi:hypothetical protein